MSTTAAPYKAADNETARRSSNRTSDNDNSLPVSMHLDFLVAFEDVKAGWLGIYSHKLNRSNCGVPTNRSSHCLMRLKSCFLKLSMGPRPQNSA